MRGASIRTSLRLGLTMGWCLWGTASEVQAASSLGSAAGVQGAVVASGRPILRVTGVDADGRAVLVNQPGRITVVLATNEHSQDAARAAGQSLYPFQGRSDFKFIVVADLRDSMAKWVPSLVISRTRVSLDHEALQLKPYFLKNGNKSDPRKSCCVIPDFAGTICPQLGWAEPSSHLRVILFGVDGREIKRWDKLADENVLPIEVEKAIQGMSRGSSSP